MGAGPAPLSKEASSMPENEQSASGDLGLPDDLRMRLAAAGIADHDEVALRQSLERQVPGYNLFRLTPAAAGIVRNPQTMPSRRLPVRHRITWTR
jgi:hypothetical protein